MANGASKHRVVHHVHGLLSSKAHDKASKLNGFAGVTTSKGHCPRQGLNFRISVWAANPLKVADLIDAFLKLRNA